MHAHREERRRWWEIEHVPEQVEVGGAAGEARVDVKVEAALRRGQRAAALACVRVRVTG